MYWENALDTFGKTLLGALGVPLGTGCGMSKNPITDALRSGDFVEKYKDIKGFGLDSVSRVAVICQIAVYDFENSGPDDDGQAKPLRRQWYHWFKVRFAQPFSEQMGQDIQKTKWATDWAGRMSRAFSYLVDSRMYTYRELWVVDGSRMIYHDGNCLPLVERRDILICVEKDSLFDDYKVVANAMGAQALYSGKGKSSKAAIEKLTDQHFNRDRPLYVLSVTDFDYDGQAVIAPAFTDQLRRYKSDLVESRAGVVPEQVDDWDSKYRLKLRNDGYREWANENAIFEYVCDDCGTESFAKGTDVSTCVSCGGECVPDLDKPYGFEVEALTSRDYRVPLVEALLKVFPFDELVSLLRSDCTADASLAADWLADSVFKENEEYQQIQKALEKYEALRDIVSQFESECQGALWEEGYSHQRDWKDDDDDPTEDEFKDWVHNSYGRGPWRPFDRNDRTNSLRDLLEDGDAYDEWTKQQVIPDDRRDEFKWVFDDGS